MGKVASPPGTKVGVKKKEKSMAQLLDEWGTMPPELQDPEDIPRKEKPKVPVPKSKWRLLMLRLLGNDRRSYELDETLRKALGKK